MKKVWILDDEWFSHDVEKGIYEENGFEYLITRSDTLDEDFQTFGKDADGIVAQVGFDFGRSYIEQLTKCKIIASSGVGFNHIDLEATKERGIYVTNMADYCIDEVSDHTIALALIVALRMRAYNDQIRNGEWNPLNTLPIHRLQGRTFGILGFGRIAREVARKIKPFGMKVIAHDAYVDEAAFEEAGVESVSLDELFDRANILTLHVPLTPETEGLVNEVRLRQMPKDAIILNTCRGAVINEADLEKVIKDGHIAGAGLDVLTEEPPSDDLPLLHMEEVYVTPHSSYVSVESEYELRSRTSNNVIRAVNGERPEFVVNGL